MIREIIFDGRVDRGKKPFFAACFVQGALQLRQSVGCEQLRVMSR